jgi:hypothetical protein
MRPVDEPAEDPQDRGQERDRHEQGDQHRQRQRGAEGPDELEAGRVEGGGPGGHREPGREDDREEIGRGGLRGVPPFLSGPQPVAHAEQEEDRVVGQDPQDQDHDHGFQLLGDVDTNPPARPGDDPDRHDVGDRGRRQCGQRRADRPEAQPDEHGDDHEGGQLHPRQGPNDEVSLFDAGGDGAGHSDQGVAGTIGLGGVAERQVPLHDERDVRVEVQVCDPRRRGFS